MADFAGHWSHPGSKSFYILRHSLLIVTRYRYHLLLSKWCVVNVVHCSAARFLHTKCLLCNGKVFQHQPSILTLVHLYSRGFQPQWNTTNSCATTRCMCMRCVSSKLISIARRAQFVPASHGPMCSLLVDTETLGNGSCICEVAHYGQGKHSPLFTYSNSWLNVIMIVAQIPPLCACWLEPCASLSWIFSPTTHVHDPCDPVQSPRHANLTWR